MSELTREIYIVQALQAANALLAFIDDPRLPVRKAGESI